MVLLFISTFFTMSAVSHTAVLHMTLFVVHTMPDHRH